MLPIVSRLSQQAGKLLNTTHELRILLVHVRRCATHELIHNIKTWHAIGLLIHSEKGIVSEIIMHTILLLSSWHIEQKLRVLTSLTQLKHAVAKVRVSGLRVIHDHLPTPEVRQ